MRPRKVILCVDDNELDLSVLKFMLETNGFRIISAGTAGDAVYIFRTAQVDLVLANFYLPDMNGDQLVTRLKKIAAHIPIILLGDLSAYHVVHAADALLIKHSCSSSELLERIKVMSARKRGPRKKPPTPVGQELPAAHCAL